jgi:hypothetical protein
MRKHSMRRFLATAAAVAASTLGLGLAGTGAANAASAATSVAAGPVYTNSAAGYVSTGRWFRYVTTTLAVPAESPSETGSMAQVMLATSGGASVALQVIPGGGLDSVTYGGTGLGVHALNLRPAPGDHLTISVFYDQHGHVRFTAINHRSGNTQEVTRTVGSRTYTQAFVRSVFTNSDVTSPASDTLVWAFTGSHVTTYTGVRGTLLGPWDTSQLIDTKSGTRAGLVVADAPVLSNGGQNFGVWLRQTEIYTNDHAGYLTGGGWRFRYVATTLTVPAAEPEIGHGGAAIMLATAEGVNVEVQVTPGGGAGSVTYGGTGLGVHALNLSPAPGDHLGISVFYDQQGHVQFTATNNRSGNTQKVIRSVGPQIYASAYLGGIVPEYEVTAQASDTRLFAFTGSRVTTYTGVHGTITGPWRAWEMIDTADGTASGTVVADASVLSNGGQDFGVWLRATAPLAFRGLGAWVDVYDYSALNPATAINDLKAHGVSTLYLATARYDSPADILYPSDVAAWLAAAHAAGIKVVGWYVPDYADLNREVRRTLAIASYISPGGERFDGIGIDIEYPLEVPDPSVWNQAVATHLARVRAGTTLPVLAIVLPPVLIQNWPDPNRFATFPWSAISADANAVAPMSYWTSYTPAHRCAAGDLHYCAYQYTRDNVLLSAQLTGLPVHVIGGAGQAATAAEVSDYVRAARETAAAGGSFYDYQTTNAAFWPYLEQLSLSGQPAP